MLEIIYGSDGAGCSLINIGYLLCGSSTSTRSRGRCASGGKRGANRRKVNLKFNQDDFGMFRTKYIMRWKDLYFRFTRSEIITRGVNWLFFMSMILMFGWFKTAYLEPNVIAPKKAIADQELKGTCKYLWQTTTPRPGARCSTTGWEPPPVLTAAWRRSCSSWPGRKLWRTSRTSPPSRTPAISTWTSRKVSTLGCPTRTTRCSTITASRSSTVATTDPQTHTHIHLSQAALLTVQRLLYHRPRDTPLHQHLLSVLPSLRRSLALRLPHQNRVCEFKPVRVFGRHYEILSERVHRESRLRQLLERDDWGDGYRVLREIDYDGCLGLLFLEILALLLGTEGRNKLLVILGPVLLNDAFLLVVYQW